MSHNKNRGSAVVEATLVLPIFLFGMLAIFGMHESREAEAYIYEAAAETAEYMAEFAYIDETATLLVPMAKFDSYVDNRDMVERWIEGGTGGVWFLGSYIDDDDWLHLSVTYRVKVSAPFLPVLTRLRHYEIRQRVYTGTIYTDEDASADADEGKYVYVSDNHEVYHTSRDCTHLRLTIEESSLSSAKQAGYTACEFCGAGAGGHVYITPEGDRYHSSASCSGLKRTVHRVPVSDAGGVCECSRCAAKKKKGT